MKCLPIVLLTRAAEIQKILSQPTDEVHWFKLKEKNTNIGSQKQLGEIGLRFVIDRKSDLYLTPSDLQLIPSKFFLTIFTKPFS